MTPAPGPTKSRFLTIITGGFEQDFIPPLAPCSPVAEILTHPYHNTHAIFILSEEKSYTNSNFQPIKKISKYRSCCRVRKCNIQSKQAIPINIIEQYST